MKEKHELNYFFTNLDKRISAEYERISRSAAEDPGTAGDQGELNWKEILEKWLPSYFHIVTKGRIINEAGESSPQMDIIILSPEYPKGMLNCKRYLAKGVVAVFECKITLSSRDIIRFFENSKKLQEIVGHEEGTPRKELQSEIFYGLLAHSHAWKKNGSNPRRNITNAIEKAVRNYIEYPIQMPNMICVADLCRWRSFKVVYPTDVNSDGITSENLTVGVGYAETSLPANEISPIGAMIFQVSDFLSWSYPRIRAIQSYMLKLDVEGWGTGNFVKWIKGCLSEKVLAKASELTSEGCWDEWNRTIW